MTMRTLVTPAENGPWQQSLAHWLEENDIDWPNGHDLHLDDDGSLHVRMSPFDDQGLATWVRVPNPTPCPADLKWSA